MWVPANRVPSTVSEPRLKGKSSGGAVTVVGVSSASPCEWGGDRCLAKIYVGESAWIRIAQAYVFSFIGLSCLALSICFFSFLISFLFLPYFLCLPVFSYLFVPLSVFVPVCPISCSWELALFLMHKLSVLLSPAQNCNTLVYLL
jgi:hypothetical protein